MPREPQKFGGEETFAAPPERLFDVLTDWDQVAQIIPDLEKHDVVDESRMNCVVRPGFSFLRGTLKLTVEMPERERPRHAQMQVRAKGIGASLRVTSQLDIESIEGGSRLRWQAVLDETQGLVAALSPSLLQGAADAVIKSAWDRVRAELGETS